MICTVEFPSNWVNSSTMEDCLKKGTGPHDHSFFGAKFIFPMQCKIMIDAAVRLLSLFNQLDICQKSVQLIFEEGERGVMGYLDRMGFFDHLSKNIEVLPYRPLISGAEIYGGRNTSLVEIARINPENRDETLLTKLTETLMRSFGHKPDADELEGAAWTIFAELIDNIFSHSETSLDGYAALQLYPRGNSLRVAVSDSGLGIMETLRPAIKHENPSLSALSDIDLLVEIFRQGLSRHGGDRGCGLKGSAAKAIKYKADLDVRLPNLRVLLSPGREGYRLNTAYCYESLPLIWGTHIYFNFSLD